MCLGSSSNKLQLHHFPFPSWELKQAVAFGCSWTRLPGSLRPPKVPRPNPAATNGPTAVQAIGRSDPDSQVVTNPVQLSVATKHALKCKKPCVQVQNYAVSQMGRMRNGMSPEPKETIRSRLNRMKLKSQLSSRGSE